MSENFKAVKITDDIYWVGAIDWDVRNFHGYATNKGTTYNAYLIVDDKVTLIDTVKAPFYDEMMARVASVVDPAKIDIIISNHSEPDHSGGLSNAIAAIKPDKVYASNMGVKALGDHYGLTGIEEVKDGSTLKIGKNTLQFFETRMLHWPDSMFTYVKEQKFLFSQDGFGMHLASTERYDDELPFDVLEYEARKYYANILNPFSTFVKKTLQRVKDAGLEFRMIAPDHGPIWRKNVDRILSLYSRWADGVKSNKAVIIYDTMWGNTNRMARAMADGLMEGGTDVKVMLMTENHRSDAATEVFDAKALLVGSPTLNNQMFPTLADVLVYLKGLKFENLVGMAFGSFGWSGEAVGHLEQYLKDMNVEIIAKPINSKYVPDDDVLNKCRNMGLEISKRIGSV